MTRKPVTCLLLWGFDQTGKFYSGQSTFLNGAINSAVYHISNSNSKPSGKTAYILMRSDYTLGASEKFDNLSHGRESGIVVDMCGYSIIMDSSRASNELAVFNMSIKQWTGSADGIYTFATKYVIRNGTFKTHSAPIIYFKASTKNVDLSAKEVTFTFDNVKFELLPGSKLTRLIHIANATNTSSSNDTRPPLNLNFNDCTFDFKTVASSASEFIIFRTNFAETARILATVKINGGTILANKLDKNELLPANIVDGYFQVSADPTSTWVHRSFAFSSQRPRFVTKFNMPPIFFLPSNLPAYQFWTVAYFTVASLQTMISTTPLCN